MSPYQLTLAERDQPLQAGSHLAESAAASLLGRAPGKPARDRAETLPGARLFRVDGRAPPRSSDIAGDAARRLRGRGFASRRAGTREGNRAPRTREAARTILDRQVETAQTNGQPTPRTMHYQHDISRDSRPRVRAPNERISRPPVRPWTKNTSVTKTIQYARQSGFWRRTPAPSIPKIEDFCSPATRVAGTRLTQSDQARG